MSNIHDHENLNLTESEISKIIGLSIEITLKNQTDIIKGIVYSFIKNNNLLILIRRDDVDHNSINSVIVNINQISSIKHSETKEEVIKILYQILIGYRY